MTAALLTSWPNLADPDTLRKWPRKALAVLGVVAAACVLLLAVRARADLEAAVAAREAAEQVRPGSASAPVAAVVKQDARSRRRAEQTVQLAQALQIDWARRLLAIEKAAARSVYLVELRVDAGRAAVELRGEVESLEKLRPFHDALLEAGAVAVAVVRHEPSPDASTHRQQFSATVQW